MILRGEPGVGKTRLLSELAARLEVDGFRVLWGRCLRFSAESSSYLPFIQALGPQVDLVATGESATVLERVSAAVDAGLRAGPVALVIDDIQWADASSLDALAYLVSGFRQGQPLLVLGTFRDTELGAGHPLHSWLADMRRMPGFSLLPIDRLDRHDTGLLVEAILGEGEPDLIETTFERSKGNPYLAELLLTGVDPSSDDVPDPVPTDLRAALLAAWHRTNEPTRALMQVLAVGGRPIDVDVLEQVSASVGLNPDMVESGVALGASAGMVTTGYDQFVWFRHPLIAEVIATTVSRRRATHLHRQYLAVWLSVGHVHEHSRAAHLALHAEAAGETAQALIWSLRAADETEKVRGYAEESQHLARACRLWPELHSLAESEAGEYVTLLRRAIRAARRAGDHQLGLRLAKRAYQLADRKTDPLTTAELLNELNLLRLLAGNRAPIAAFHEAVEISKAHPRSPQHVRALAELAMQERHHGVQDGEGHAQDALRLARQGESEEAVAHALLAVADARRGHPESVELAQESLALARSTAEAWLISNAALCASNCLLEVGRGREAARLLIQVRAEMVRAGAPHEAAKAAIAAADLLYWFGDWDQARGLLRNAMSVRLPPLWARWARLTAAELAAHSGQAGPAEQHLRRAEELGGDAEEPRNGFIAAKSYVLMVRDEYRAALDLILTEMAAVVRTDPTLADDLMVRAAAVAADAHQGDPAVSEVLEAIETERRRLLPPMFEPTSSHDPVPAAYAALYAAHRSRTNDPAGGDINLWALATQACEVANMDWAAAQAKFRLASALLMQRRSPARAASALRSAHSTSMRLGADTLRLDIEALTSQARLSLEEPQAEALQSMDGPLLTGLTRREREVLELLVAGRTYAEIAGMLFISEKTVGAHVSHLLRKTQTSNRIQLSELARRHMSPEA